ncbi:TetR/AcrR family transcriptional regulator [Aestuariicella hydrocarbonica]|uniref:TetR/AcrR family transcriptional regulator n=1 Tax=Pseudomaricurvus hydrocarbonicus TaxID=1470433 RepID=A0A9E5MM90_9GAMM|nr:TetR/AcrR family transcriptional regulator [Aestuariicella hydrocarbonica]NHO66623.1 TetR/AcrR family transcriptional regulator [Aestuariicella hydrocarbonica]
MARTPTVSDEQILESARQVMGRRGPEAFTLAEVASEVKLSRAAIILRFKSTQALKVRLLTQMVERFEGLLTHLPQTPGGNSLLAIAAFIGKHAGSKESSASFFSTYSQNIQDTELAALEVRRGKALSDAVSKAMPQTVIDHDSAVVAFRAHMAGSIMAFQASAEKSSQEYLLQRTQEWLRLARIPFDETETVINNNK